MADSVEAASSETVRVEKLESIAPSLSEPLLTPGVPLIPALSASVGRGGVNRPADVLALKARLRELGFGWIPPGNRIDSPTLQAIRLFQAIKNGHQQILTHPQNDGLIEPGRETWRWLASPRAPRWQIMPEGSRPEGFLNIERGDAHDRHDWGTSWLVETLCGAAAAYRDVYLPVHPTAALVTVNDASLPRGGNTPDHERHETGLCVDLRLPRLDGSAPGGTTCRMEVFDREAARAQLLAFREQPLVSLIYFNDEALLSDGLCEWYESHEDHVHVEIRPPGGP